MTDDIMTVARDHLVVLLNEQKELLQALLRGEGLLHSRTKDGKERVLSRERAEEILEFLEGEEDKVSRLEITLAVAGTVNAGKSTVVNAIIGTEALPHRPNPMTALPTVIRHEPDLLEPRLTINNAAALNCLADRIACKLQDVARWDAVPKVYKDDMEALIDDLADGGGPVFGKEYEGRDRVFEALRRINDLLRLGRHESVGEALDIEEYDDLDEMPALAVHFRCLVDTAQQSGSIALLDLPGFNEAQLSEHLKDMLEEHLEKASAILVVLDYTQRNTEASEELEMLLDAVSGIMQGRIFVVVNKFDQRRSRDPDATALMAQISADLMNGAVDPQHVFPVSAQRAYLAGRAREALNRNGGFPSVDDEPWVIDFVDFILQGDDTKLNDLEEVERVVDSRWQQSGFQPLLDRVVVAAQRRAGEFAVKSALEKLKQYGGEMEDHLKLFTVSLTKDVRCLENTILRMNENVQAAEKSKGDVDTQIDMAMSEIDAKIDEILIDANNRIRTEIEDLFNSEVEKIVAAKQKEKKRKGAQSSRSEFYFFGMYQDAIGKDDVGDWLELVEEFREKEKLEYTNERDRDDAWSKIKTVYSTMAAQIVDDASSLIDTLMIRTHDDLNRMLGDGLRNVLAEARRFLRDGGIEVNLQDPDFDPGTGSGKPAAIRLRKEKEIRNLGKRTVVTNEFWDSLDLLDWLGLGKEEVPHVQEVYVIDRKKVLKSLEKGVTDTLGNYRQRVDASITDWKQHVDKRFSNVRKYLDRYHQNLIDGLGNSRMERESREQLLAVARRMERRVDINRANVRDFEKATGRLLNVR